MESNSFSVNRKLLAIDKLKFKVQIRRPFEYKYGFKWAAPTIKFCKSNNLNGLQIILEWASTWAWQYLQFLYPLDRCNPKNCIKFINLIIFRLKSCSKFCSQLFLRERYDYLSTLYNIYGALKIPSSSKFLESYQLGYPF